MSSIEVRTGAMIALRLFDVAFAIDLAEVEAIWSAGPRMPARRSRLAVAPAKAIDFDVPPLLLELEPVQLRLGAATVTASASARLYDFGVVALALKVVVGVQSWEHFLRDYDALDRAVKGSGADSPWRMLLDPLLLTLAPALERPSASRLEEDYLLAIVQQWSEPLSAVAVQERVDLVPLLSGERRALSESARRDVLRQRFSYYEDDLVVLAWDRAFIYEPRGDTDVADVIEVANAQLLELRYYDQLLDDELPLMYQRIEQARRTVNLLAPRHFAQLAHKLHTLVAEVTELTGKVDNTLKVTGDVYLARVYTSALELFRVPTVGAAVQRKVAIVRDTYTSLHDEASSARGALLEMAIVALIVFEIVIALLRR
jgi:hypothetical protein